MKVEVLVAREDGMWDTKIEEIPEHVVMSPAADFSTWCSLNLPHERYGDAVMFAPYNTDPEQDEEGRW